SHHRMSRRMTSARVSPTAAAAAPSLAQVAGANRSVIFGVPRSGGIPTAWLPTVGVDGAAVAGHTDELRGYPRSPWSGACVGGDRPPVLWWPGGRDHPDHGGGHAWS